MPSLSPELVEARFGRTKLAAMRRAAELKKRKGGSGSEVETEDEKGKADSDKENSVRKVYCRRFPEAEEEDCDVEDGDVEMAEA